MQVFPKRRVMGSNWLQPKQKLLIPSRVAIALQEEGWLLRNDIIWHKENAMPSSVKDRLSCTYEHVLFFVKSRRYYYDLDAIREPHKSIKEMENYYAESKIDKAKRFRRRGTQFQQVPIESPHRSSKDVIGRYKTLDESFKGPQTMRQAPEPGEPHAFHELGKNPGDVLAINTEPSSDYWCPKCKRFVEIIIDSNKDMKCILCKTKVKAHFAVYPKKLCRIPILASCPTQVCPRCGKPREKILRKTGRIQQQWAPGTAAERSELAQGKHGSTSVITTGYKFTYEVIGLSICNCNAGFEPGVLLDPMCGIGTTLVVAKELGRNFIGIDINPDYCEMARKKLSMMPEDLTKYFPKQEGVAVAT